MPTLRPTPPEITILNGMASRDLEAALDRHVQWGLTLLDLKDCIFGKNVAELTDAEALTAAQMISERGLRVYALSTSLFHEVIEAGEAVFRGGHLAALPRVLEIAQALSPRVIRLIAPSTTQRAAVVDAIAYARVTAPWLMDVYDEAIARIAAAGFAAVIENETGGSLLSRPEEALAFFASLSQAGKASFTWDIVNMWQAGTFPTTDVYEALKPITGYIHLKGGQSDEPMGPLAWKSPLEEATWPVGEIVSRIVRDGTCPVVCINPPHGALRPGTATEGWVERDIRYLRALMNQATQGTVPA